MGATNTPQRRSVARLGYDPERRELITEFTGAGRATFHRIPLADAYEEAEGRGLSLQVAAGGIIGSQTIQGQCPGCADVGPPGSRCRDCGTAPYIDLGQ
jgi:hypothetical protein